MTTSQIRFTAIAVLDAVLGALFGALLASLLVAFGCAGAGEGSTSGAAASERSFRALPVFPAYLD